MIKSVCLAVWREVNICSAAWQRCLHLIPFPPYDGALKWGRWKVAVNGRCDGRSSSQNLRGLWNLSCFLVLALSTATLNISSCWHLSSAEWEKGGWRRMMRLDGEERSGRGRQRRCLQLTINSRHCSLFKRLLHTWPVRAAFLSWS